MKKKTISIMIVALMSAMTATSMTGCGTQANATNVQISEENLDDTVVIDGEEIVVNGENVDTEDESSDLTSNEDIVFYEDQQGVSEDVDLRNLTVMEPAVELHFNADTDVYDMDGNLVGYVKADAYVAFHNYNEKWSGFELNGTEMLMKMEDLQKNAVNEAVAEAINQGEPVLEEDVTDGNIVLYGGEKNPQKYSPLDEGIPEEVNIILTNVEADIPLYSWDGRLCGHLNKGGNIVVTEHCTVATAWYRFPNPIEGTEHEYLYVLRYETLTTNDEKELIEEVLRSAGDAIKILDAPDSDMKCREFSIEREKYHKVSDYIFRDDFLYYEKNEEPRGWIYKTFYVECARNGDNFDCKVYYK